jgi:membrane protein YqaA with SNARE-associated domain
MKARILFNQYLSRLQTKAGTAWMVPAFALLAAIDLFVAFIPSDALVITAALVKPRQWLYAALTISLGSALGAGLLAALVYQFSPDTSSLSWFAEWVKNYGPLALCLFSAGPLPQQPAVALCALAGMPLPHVMAAVFIGRALKYGLFAWSATHAPKLLAHLTRLLKINEQRNPSSDAHSKVKASEDRQ